jgi:PPOX class probable F420-dependent enzyme
MDHDKARDFLRHNSKAVLATMRADGRPQLSPINQGVDDQGRVLISTREPSFKARNIRRDPRVSLCALNDGFFGEWVRIDGRASILSLPDAMEVLVDLYRRIAGEHPDWDDYRAAMVRDQRCVIVIDIERAGPDRAG